MCGCGTLFALNLNSQSLRSGSDFEHVHVFGTGNSKQLCRTNKQLLWAMDILELVVTFAPIILPGWWTRSAGLTKCGNDTFIIKVCASSLAHLPAFSEVTCLAPVWELL